MRVPATATFVVLSILVVVGGQQNITTALAQRPELSNLTTYLGLYPEFVQQLNTLQNITLAAPTNDAFTKSLNSSNTALTTSETDAVKGFWTYLILNGTNLFSGTSKSRVIATALQDGAYTRVPGGAVVKYRSQAMTLLSGDGIESALGLTTPYDGGEIVLIDTLPQTPTNISATRSSISILSQLSDFDGLDSTAVTTYFIPSDTAWLAHTGVDPSPNPSRVVPAHVISGQVLYSSNGGKDVATEYGSDITFNKSGGTSLGQTFEYVLADIPLFNGVMHIIDRVLDPFNTTAQGPNRTLAQASASASATTSSSPSATASPSPPSGLSAGAKAGIGVGVALGVILAALIGFFVYRRRRKTPTRSKEGTPHVSPAPAPQEHDKPELKGSAYDATIAGPVKRKTELETTTSVNSVVDAPRAGTAELGEHDRIVNAQSNELSASQSTRRTDPSTASDQSTAVNSSDRTGEPSMATMLGGPGSSSLQQPPLQTTESHEELTEEADTLVSELGVIQKRKKALNAAAAAAGTSAEEVEGRKGEEYRRLLGREESVRKRMEQVQEALR